MRSAIVALRGQLMQELPRGSMLAVGCSAEKVEKACLPATLQIASNNAPALCVVSGPEADVAAFRNCSKDKILSAGICILPMHFIPHDGPHVEPLRVEVAKVRLNAPSLPFVSTVTGKPITESETTDPGYWSQHARSTVQFSKAVQWLIGTTYDLFLECGPRSTFSSLVRQHFTPDRSDTAIPTFADSHENNAEWVNDALRSWVSLAERSLG